MKCADYWTLCGIDFRQRDLTGFNASLGHQSGIAKKPRCGKFRSGCNKTKALVNLDMAFQRKANVLKGEQMPDPRADSSFQRYVRDSDFVNLMKKLGLQ